MSSRSLVGAGQSRREVPIGRWAVAVAGLGLRLAGGRRVARAGQRHGGGRDRDPDGGAAAGAAAAGASDPGEAAGSAAERAAGPEEVGKRSAGEFCGSIRRRAVGRSLWAPGPGQGRPWAQDSGLRPPRSLFAAGSAHRPYRPAQQQARTVSEPGCDPSSGRVWESWRPDQKVRHPHLRNGLTMPPSPGLGSAERF